MRFGKVNPNKDSSSNLYDNIQLDLINVESLPIEANYLVLRRFSTAAVIAASTRQMMRTLLRCNKTTQMNGVPEIFKQTTQSTDAMVALQGIVVRNENDLREYSNISLYGYLRKRRRPKIKISQRKRRIFGKSGMRAGLEFENSP